MACPTLSSIYFSNVEEHFDTDAISLEELDHSHPRKIITLYNGYSPESKEDYEISYFNTESIIEMISKEKYFNPITRVKFDSNQIKRVEWYKQCLEMFPLVKPEDILDYKKIISEWLVLPFEQNEKTDYARFFTTYDQIIDYFGFKDLVSREKAEEYFLANPDKSWTIRKSSVKDTKYNQFFVIMIKKSVNYDNYLYVHRQGYGVCRVDGNRYADISSVSIVKSEYYTNIIDLLIHFMKLGIIKL